MARTDLTRQNAPLQIKIANELKAVLDQKFRISTLYNHLHFHFDEKQKIVVANNEDLSEKIPSFWISEVVDVKPTHWLFSLAVAIGTADKYCITTSPKIIVEVKNNKTVKLLIRKNDDTAYTLSEEVIAIIQKQIRLKPEISYINFGC